jgi:mRNA-degrading endonuclease RelE of RelBE toxin-antitoxin system
MINIDIVDNAFQDIARLRSQDRLAAVTILSVLEQVKADPDVLDKLTTHGDNFIGSVRLGVKRWQAMRNKGNLWRFRIFDTPASSYRVVYGYHWQTRQICIFAVVDKGDFDYDDLDSDIARRISADWKSL